MQTTLHKANPDPISGYNLLDLLESADPIRYHKAGRFTVSHTGQPLAGGAVQWCGSLGPVICFTWFDCPTASTDEIAAKLEQSLSEWYPAQ